MARAKVEAVDGVGEAHPITAIPIIYNKNNQRTPVYIIVYDSAGGPFELIEGEAPQFGNNIVIDQSLAQKYQMTIGDKFMLTDFEFIVSGITKEAAFMMPFAFINYDGMIDLFLESEIAPDLSTFPLLSYLLIQLEPQSTPSEVAQSIEETVASVDVHLISDLANNDINLGRTFFSPIMGVLVSVGYVIGLLVISLIMYSEISSGRKNYAVLKALGFPVSKLLLGVMLQSLVLFLLAIPLAVFFALLSAFMIESAAPVYLINIISPVVLAQTLTACLGFALCGGFIPLVSLNRCDPMMAF